MKVFVHRNLRARLRTTIYRRVRTQGSGLGGGGDDGAFQPDLAFEHEELGLVLACLRLARREQWPVVHGK